MTEFDRYLRRLPEEPVGRIQVATAYYFLEQEKDNPSPSNKDIRELLKFSRATVAPNQVGPYKASLIDSEWLTASGDGARLTMKGVEEMESLLEVGRDVQQRDDVFLDTDILREERYIRLKDDINACYQNRIYDATMVLTRKLFEDLVFRILRGEYGGEDVQMYYDLENEEHYTFDTLLSKLNEGVPRVRQHSQRLTRDLVEDVREMKEEGNQGAHVIRTYYSDDDVAELGREATRLLDVLYDVFRGVKISNEDSADEE